MTKAAMKKDHRRMSAAEKRADKEEYRNLSARGRDYRWTSKDPVIDLIRTEAQLDNNGRLTKDVLDKISYDSGVGVSTLREWFFGATRFPRRLTTRFVMEAIGITTRHYRRDGSEILRNS